MPSADQPGSLEIAFEAWFKSAENADVFSFLAQHPTPVLDEQFAVLLLDQARSWRYGERRTVDEYMAKLPSLALRPDLLAKLVVEELGYRTQQGEAVEPVEYLERFPNLSQQLEALLQSKGCFVKAGCQTDSWNQLANVATLIHSAADQSTGIGRRDDHAADQPRIGRYEILEEIARGGMGVVYKAYDRQLDRTAAIKLIRSGEWASSAELERFELESRAAAQFDHPGIVSIYEVGHEGRQHYLAMAYIDGHSLWQRVKESPLLPRDAARVMQQVAQAIQYAHERGIVHRDLKPQNILLTKDGQPKVTDFGLAKRQDDDLSLTETGQALGTPAYMPPEQAQGKLDQVGPRSDVYSLGATLYCLLTGRPPFQAATTLDTLLQVVEQEPVYPRQLNPAIPIDLETICLKCLEKEPAKRYASAADLAADLGFFQRDEPILARPVSWYEHAWRWCRRNPTVAGLSSAAILLLTAIAAISTVAYVRESQLVSEKDVLVLQKDALVHREQAARAQAIENEQIAVDHAAQLQVKTDELAHEVARTKEANERAQRDLYRALLAKAAADLQSHDHTAAAESLSMIPWKQRGWEYHYLCRQCEGALLTLRGHLGSIFSVAFSSDGTRLASGSIDQTVKLWDAETGAELHTLRGHTSMIESVTFSPDGTRLASASVDRTIKLWDAATGTELQTLHGHVSNITSLAFSPDGTRLASGSIDQTIKLWDAATGTELHTLRGHTNIVASVVFSPDGTRLASGAFDHTIKLWSVASRSELKTLRGHGSGVASVAFSPDGTRLASGSGDQTIKLWDAATGIERQTLRGHSSEVTSLAFSPDGTRLASASVDHSIKVWDTVTGTEFQTLRGHGSTVRSIAFSPDGTRLASGAFDQTIKLWSMVTRSELNTLRGHSKGVHSVAFSPDGTRLVSGSPDQTIKVWDAVTGAELGTLRGNGNPVAFSSDGTRLASASVDQTIKVWDAVTGTELKPLRGHTSTVRSLAFSLDGTRLASGASDQTIKVWDMATGADLHTLRGHDREVNSVAFSPDGTRLASGADDQSIKLWDVATGAELRSLRGHAALVRSIAFSPDGTRLASGSFDQTIKLWDTGTGVELQSLRGHTNWVLSVAFSPDGMRLASGSYDRTIKLWDTVTGDELQTLRGHEREVVSVAFSSDGKRLASGASDQTIKLWDATFGHDVLRLRGHSSPVVDIRFSRDGQRIRSESQGGKFVWWSLPDGELLTNEFLPDPSTLVRNSPHPLIRAFPYGTDVLLIRKNARHDPWAEDARRRKKLTPQWHADQAAKAEQSQDWYAAAVHLGWLMKLSPDDSALQFRRDYALTKIRAQEILSPQLPRP